MLRDQRTNLAETWVEDNSIERLQNQPSCVCWRIWRYVGSSGLSLFITEGMLNWLTIFYWIMQSSNDERSLNNPIGNARGSHGRHFERTDKKTRNKTKKLLFLTDSTTVLQWTHRSNQKQQGFVDSWVDTYDVL